MKKFTLLSSLAALATIGSVYAAWTFNEGLPSIDDQSAVTVTVTELNGSQDVAGEITVTGTMTVTFDQLNSNEKAWTTKVSASGGSFEVLYEPEENAPDKTYVLTFTIDDTAYYKGVTWTEEVNKSSDSAEVTAAELVDKITGIVDTIRTSAEYSAFKTSVASGIDVRVTVNEKVQG